MNTPEADGGLGRSYSAIGFKQLTELDKFSQEIRLVSDFSKALSWVIGGVYTHEVADKNQALDPRDLTGQPAVNDLSSLDIPTLYKDYAFFGDLTYRITNKIDVTGGIRHARNDQRVTQTGSGLFLPNGSRPERTASETVNTYLANARYHFNNRAIGYLRYATGYRPGGPNIVRNDPITGLPLAQPTFDADKLKSYEAGFKAESDSRRFGIDLAGYSIDWNDIQIVAIRNGIGVRTNAPGAKVRGAELTVTARPLSGLMFTSAMSYIDAYLSAAAPDLAGAKGERLSYVPRFSASLNADYELNVSAWRPMVSATVSYMGDRATSFNADPLQYHMPDYTTVDLRTGINLNSFTLQLYVHNLFDERGQLTAGSDGVQIGASIQQPRTIGITATTHF